MEGKNPQTFGSTYEKMIQYQVFIQNQCLYLRLSVFISGEFILTFSENSRKIKLIRLIL